jgi:hypothetical protein
MARVTASSNWFFMLTGSLAVTVIVRSAVVFMEKSFSVLRLNFLGRLL